MVRHFAVLAAFTLWACNSSLIELTGEESFSCSVDADCPIEGQECSAGLCLDPATSFPPTVALAVLDTERPLTEVTLLLTLSDPNPNDTLTLSVSYSIFDGDSTTTLYEATLDRTEFPATQEDELSPYEVSWDALADAVLMDTPPTDATGLTKYAVDTEGTDADPSEEFLRRTEVFLTATVVDTQGQTAQATLATPLLIGNENTSVSLNAAPLGSGDVTLSVGIADPDSVPVELEVQFDTGDGWRSAAVYDDGIDASPPIENDVSALTPRDLPYSVRWRSLTEPVPDDAFAPQGIGRTNQSEVRLRVR
ncbi:MAG: hypothetical protein AAFQ82_06870, partial [Myxococcota bacterium]